MTTRNRAFLMLLWITVLCGLVFGLAADRAHAQDEQKPGIASPRVAVADITRIFDAYQRRQDYQDELEGTGKALREREQLLRARITRLETDIAKLAMGHPQRVELLNELAKEREAFRQFSIEARRELDDAVRKSTQLLYEDIVRVIEEYARFHNIDLVIKQQSFKPQQASAENQAHSIGRRSVLYSAPDMDITDPIIKILNARAKEAKVGKE